MQVELEQVEGYVIRQNVMTFVCPRCGRRTVTVAVATVGEWQGKAICLICVDELDGGQWSPAMEFKSGETFVYGERYTYG